MATSHARAFLLFAIMLSVAAVEVTAARPLLDAGHQTTEQRLALRHFEKHGRRLQAPVPRIESLELRLSRTGDAPLRPCRGIDIVTTISEMHIARSAGIRMSDLSTSKLVCGPWGVTITLSFITYPGQVLGVNAASLGHAKLQQLLADPFEEQFNLTLASFEAIMEQEA